MKPFSIVLSLVLGLAALAFIVWIGRFGGALPVTTSSSAEGEANKAATKVEEIPLPKSGPFGKAEVAESEFNFGVKNVGDKDEHTFSIKNVGEGRWGGAITAAKFLEEFVNKTPWTHIDIAGPAFLDSPKPWCDAGGSGTLVRTFAEMLSGS